MKLGTRITEWGLGLDIWIGDWRLGLGLGIWDSVFGVCIKDWGFRDLEI